MIKFITNQQKNKTLTFDDVEEDQFFVDKNKYLCQKAHSEAANIIANDKGKPLCDHLKMNGSEPIQRIISNVIKIEF